MDGENSPPAVRSAGTLSSSTSPPSGAEIPPPVKRPPPHIRLRLMRQQEEAAAAAALKALAASEPKDATGLSSEAPKEEPSEKPSWKPSREQPRPPFSTHEAVTKTETSRASAETGKGTTTQAHGAAHTQHKTTQRPTVTVPQEKREDKKERVERPETWITETVQEPFAIDPHSASVQKPPSSPPMSIQKTSTLAHPSYGSPPHKSKSNGNNHGIHSFQTTSMPSNFKPTVIRQEALNTNASSKSIHGHDTNILCDPNTINVWGSDAANEETPPRSIVSHHTGPRYAPAQCCTASEKSVVDDTRLQDTLSEKSIDVAHGGMGPPLYPAQSAMSEAPEFKEPFARPVVLAKITVPTEASPMLTTAQEEVLSEIYPETRDRPSHRGKRKSVSSIVTNKNVNFTGEDIEVVHAVPRPRQYMDMPFVENGSLANNIVPDGEAPGHQNSLSTHPVVAADSCDIPTGSNSSSAAAVAAKGNASPELVVESIGAYRAAMWVHQMRRFRTADVVGGRAEALRDESQVHHDFYGYPMQMPQTAATAAANRKAGGPDTTLGMGMVGSGGDPADMGGATLDPMNYPPMEPTGPLYRMRMMILANFAVRCREAKHRVKVVPEPRPPVGVEVHSLVDGVKGQKEYFATCGPSSAAEAVPASTKPTREVATTSAGPCPQCAAADAFTMRPQHGQLFLESVLHPLSEATTYADMLVHINTSVAERIYAEAGMNARADDPAYPWEDIKAMPVYEDYQGALVLATHRRRVMEDLPMVVDDAGMIKGIN